MRTPSSRPATVALVVAALAVLLVAGRLLSSLPNAKPPTTSSAPTAGPVRLPDLIGQSLAQAKTTLDQLGLKDVVQVWAVVQAQMGSKGVLLHPKSPPGVAGARIRPAPARG